MNDLPKNHAFGVEYFRFSDLQPLSVDGYFDCINLLRPLFKDADFIASTPGYYLNWITNRNGESGNSARLSYYTTNPAASLKVIKNFAANNKEIAIFNSKHSQKPDPTSLLDTHDEDQLIFRNFLNRNTQIFLDVLEGYGEQPFAELVTRYRDDLYPQRIPPEQHFCPVFEKHSESFCKLKEAALDDQYWRDLVHLHCGKDFGLHFLVNMLAVPDPYDPSFWKEDWIAR